MNKLFTILLFASGIASCSSPAKVQDNRPQSLKRFIANLDIAEEKNKQATNQDIAFGEELARVNRFIDDSLQQQVDRWPGKLADVHDHPEYVSFAVHILKHLDDTASDARFRSIILTSVVQKNDTAALNMLNSHKEQGQVLISGALVVDEGRKALVRSYSSYEDSPFINPVLEVSYPKLSSP